jgi:acetyltransferase-like isoleucine patch superfamily enzyme
MPPEHRAWRWRYLNEPELAWHLPLIAETAIVEAFASIDGGLERPTVIGERAFIMKHAHVGHDAYIGPDVNLAPGCVIGGFVHVGAACKVGIGAVIRPRVDVGNGAVIGAGAVVVDDVPAGETWVGNPARPLRNHKGPTMAPDHWAGSEEEYELWLEAFGPGYQP